MTEASDRVLQMCGQAHGAAACFEAAARLQPVRVGALYVGAEAAVDRLSAVAFHAGAGDEELLRSVMHDALAHLVAWRPDVSGEDAVRNLEIALTELQEGLGDVFPSAWAS